MYKKIILVISSVIIIVGLSAALTCCMSYRPIWKENIPDECNIYLNVNKMYYESKDKSMTVPAFEYCIKKLHRLSCQAEIFGIDEKGKPNPVQYDDPKLYRAYTDR